MSNTAPVLTDVSNFPSYLEPLLLGVAERGASDAHFQAGHSPWIRHGASLMPELSVTRMTPEEIHSLAIWAGGPDSSTSRVIAGRRWRATSYLAIDGWRVTFRLIPDQAPDFSQLGLGHMVESLVGATSGLIVTAGPTGSGKTTTLASLITRIINSRQVKLITIEDPVEYIYQTDMSIVSQRDLSSVDAATSLQTAMRSDCDIVLLGEIRAPEEAKLCLELAASGHLVLTTIHARDTGTVCERFATMTGDVGRSILAQTLRAVISQRLLEASDSPKRRWLAAEVMIMNPDYRSMIRPGGSLTRMESSLLNERKGMDSAIARLLQEGKITKATAMRNALNQDFLTAILEGGVY